GTPTGMPPKPPGTPPGTLCTGGSVPTSKAHPSHPSNPSTERRPQVSDREAFGGGCEGAEMTRVDRLRADGWTECGTCGGSGKVDSSCSDQCDYEVACPDCVDGRVPPDGMVEAAARWAHAEMGRRSGVGLTWEAAYPEEQADYMRIARSMLVAAARWEAPE